VFALYARVLTLSQTRSPSRQCCRPTACSLSLSAGAWRVSVCVVHTVILARSAQLVTMSAPPGCSSCQLRLVALSGLSTVQTSRECCVCVVVHAYDCVRVTASRTRHSATRGLAARDERPGSVRRRSARSTDAVHHGCVRVCMRACVFCVRVYDRMRASQYRSPSFVFVWRRSSAATRVCASPHSSRRRPRASVRRDGVISY
jgi:hypothetical protein